MRKGAAFAALIGWGAWHAANAVAGSLVVRVIDARGAPAPDAVVTVQVAGETASGAGATKTIDQRDETFVPYIEVFRPGDRVVFHNSDPTRHHVYSFSPAKPFEFVVAPNTTSEAVTLDKTGAIAVGCNIHDHMIAYLYVSDARYVAKTGADGAAHFDALPDGDYTILAWHPQMRPGKAVPTQTIALDAAHADGALAFPLALLPDPRRKPDRERSGY